MTNSIIPCYNTVDLQSTYSAYGTLIICHQCVLTDIISIACQFIDGTSANILLLMWENNMVAIFGIS